MPWRRKNRQQLKHRQSFFSDQVIKDFSVSSCPCELYFPEPSLTYDEFGAIKDVCISGDTLTLLWNKHCLMHLCAIQGVSSDFQFSLEDTGQDCEVCLSVVLNRSKTGDFSYQIRDKFWHEYSHKVGDRWRRFVLKFDNENEEQFRQFEEKLKDILREVNKAGEAKSNKLYLLVAVQTNYEKRKSSSSLNRHSKLSLLDLQEIGSDPVVNTGTPSASPSEPISPIITEDSPGSCDSSSEGGRDSSKHYSLTPPFDPAPYIPYGDVSVDKAESLGSVHDAVFLKSINHLWDSLHIHPNELPQTLSSILKSATVSADDLEDPFERSKHKLEFGSLLKQKPPAVIRRGPKKFENDLTERLNSEFLSSDDLYLPMGHAVVDNPKEEKKTPKIMAEQDTDNPRMQKAQEVGQLLQTAINNRDAMSAQEYAKQLAAQNVTVTVKIQTQTSAEKEKDKDFNLKVNLEDKDSSGGTITLKVRASDTIRDLKNRMLIKHLFPVEVQYWIIGKRIPNDNETLERCRIKSHGYTAFLYLISAKAAGINREDVIRRQKILLNPDYAMAQAQQLQQTPSPAAAAANQTPSRQGSSATPGSGATGSASAGKPKLEPRILEENFNIIGKNEKNTPEKLQGQGQVKTPVQKQTKNEPNVNRVRQTGAEIAQSLQQIGPQFGAALGAYPVTPYGESRQRIPIMHPEENEEPQQGWSCPACTYINKPTRPGCELCSHTRPLDYEIPADYVMTEEEKKRLDMEALIESQTREVPPGGQDRKYDSDSERDLDNLLQFHDALQDTLQRMPSDSPQRQSPVLGQGQFLRRHSAGEIGSEDDNVLS